MRLKRLVIGWLETEAGNIAVDEAEEPGDHDLRKPEWHTPVAMGESVERLAEDILGHYVVAATETDERCNCRLSCVASDVAPRIAPAHHQHPFAAEFIRRAIGHRMSYR